MSKPSHLWALCVAAKKQAPSVSPRHYTASSEVLRQQYILSMFFCAHCVHPYTTATLAVQKRQWRGARIKIRLIKKTSLQLTRMLLPDDSLKYMQTHHHFFNYLNLLKITHVDVGTFLSKYVMLAW